MMGVFFAAGWSPCIGTTLGAILTLGFSAQTSGQAMLLSSEYALGLGVPFLLIGLGIDRALNTLQRFRRYAVVFVALFLAACACLYRLPEWTSSTAWWE